MMNKSILTCLSLILLFSFLAACGQSANPAGQSDSSKHSSANLDTPPLQDTSSDNGEVNNMETADENPPEDQAAEYEASEPQSSEQDGQTEEPAEIKIEYEMNNIYDIKPIDDGTNDKIVLLTFDDGPKDEEMVSAMLDTLEKHKAKAIFFLNGDKIEDNPELLKQIYEEGHAIGNHAYEHLVLNKLSEQEIDQQIEKVQQLVEELIGERPCFFRPPHAAGNDYIKEKTAQEGMLYMTWSNGSLDWDRNHQTADAVIANVMEQLRPGSNILMHELPWTVEALDELLTKLEAEGYQFVNPYAIRINDETTTPSPEVQM